jgi:hypothetical protein
MAFFSTTATKAGAFCVNLFNPNCWAHSATFPRSGPPFTTMNSHGWLSQAEGAIRAASAQRISFSFSTGLSKKFLQLSLDAIKSK